MGYQTLLMIRVREDVRGFGQPVKTTINPLESQTFVYSYPQFNRKPVGILIGAEEGLVYPDTFANGWIRVHVGSDFGYVHVESVQIDGLEFPVEQRGQSVLWRMKNSFAKPAVESEQEENDEQPRKSNRKSKREADQDREAAHSNNEESHTEEVRSEHFADGQENKAE